MRAHSLGDRQMKRAHRWLLISAACSWYQDWFDRNNGDEALTEWIYMSTLTWFNKTIIMMPCTLFLATKFTPRYTADLLPVFSSTSLVKVQLGHHNNTDIRQHKSLKELGRIMVTKGPQHERFQGKIPPHFFRTLHRKNRRKYHERYIYQTPAVTITN